jgi:hypothetical protein
MNDLLSSQQKLFFVCFACRVAVKREAGQMLRNQTPLPHLRCPRCRGEMRFVGRYFKVPPRTNVAQWRKAELLWQAGWRADGYSTRGLKTVRDARAYSLGRGEAGRKYLQKQRREASREKWRRARRKYL